MKNQPTKSVDMISPNCEIRHIPNR